MRQLLLLVFSFCWTTVFGQRLSIDNTALENGKVKIHYTLTDTTAGNLYTVRVYSSLDNHLNPLEKIDGEVGIGIKPGSRQLVWDPTELGPQFKGSVSLEVRARIYVPFVQFKGFEEYKKIRRLKPYTLTWSGGTERNILNFDLMREGKKVLTIPGIANTGHHSFVLPQSVKPGIYSLRISDSKNSDEVVITDEFRVKRKWPLAAKVLPIIIAGGVISQLSGNEAPFQIPDPVSPN